MSHVQLTRQQWHAMRRELHKLNEWLAINRRPFTCGSDPGSIGAERYDRVRNRRDHLVWSMPVPRDPNGFGVMAQNWNRRRGHVLHRIQLRKRAAMVREPGEPLIDFVCRNTGFVRDERYCWEPRA